MVMEDRGSSLGEARLEDQVDYSSVFLTRWRVKEHGELFFTVGHCLMEVLLGMLDDDRLFLLDYQVPMVVRMAT